LLHILGERSDQDVVVFRTELPQLTVKTSGHGHLMISTSPGATSGNALWLGQIRDASPELIHDGTEDGTRAVLKFAPDGRILAVTDTGAPFGRLCSVDARSPGSSNWRTLVTEEPGVVLTDCAPLADPGTGEPLLLVSKSEHGEGRLLLHDAAGTELHSLTLPGPGTVSRLTTSPAGDHAWFSYTDFVTVPTVYTVDTATRRCVPDSPEQAAPGETSTRPQVRQVSYTSKDGTSVRMYLIGVPPNGDGPRPTLLTAYGGFGASALPGYSPSTLAWVQAGGIYAVASVRGGGEQGTGWHAAGRGPNKPNAIDDFTSAARWLIDEGWTTPDRLAIKGASHSGLLVAGAITREPGRYAAAVCSDALTDMLRYPQFGLGRLWTEEFGSPDDPGELDTLLGYSPYHWVRPGTSYPAVLFTCARVDPRVDSLHTRKMTAALQHANASGAPVVLRCESDVGHGARSMSRQLELQADILAFCAEHTGLVARG
jgi:prolyl oligopeptidase